MERKFEPIAIVGMGMRLPGAVHDDQTFWEMLEKGRSGHCRVPESRYNAETWCGLEARASQATTQHGYYLDDLNLKSNIDLGFWSMGKQEAAMLDPGARLLLEVVYEALESSGTTELEWRGSSTGVYVGTMSNDWCMLENRDGQNPNPTRADSYGDYILASRTSYEFDLKGPSQVIRTACSSSLVALHQACQDLQSGACTAAVVGGVNILLSPHETAVMCEQGVLSRSGICKTFDADADGYGRGEGVSAVYLKPLASAIRDGNPIRSVIRSTLVNSDGRTAGMVVPDPKAQESLMRAAYRVAGIRDEDVKKTAMVECHGTGTAVGDPIETSAVANVWGEDGIFIGSVKPNIGHGEGSSGIASLIKMTLALEHATIPPNINFQKPNPLSKPVIILFSPPIWVWHVLANNRNLVPFEEKKLSVPVQPVPWPRNRDERVSINSFGIGGTNAHVVLESAACAGVRAARRTHSTKPRLLIFSTMRQASVSTLVNGVQEYLDKNPDRVDDVAYTLNSRRTEHPWRTFGVIGAACSKFAVAPVSLCTGKPPQVCWIFTGQGAQYAQMGKKLIEQEPLVGKRIEDLDAVLQKLPDPPAWSIRDEIMKPKDTSRLHEAEISQPCLAAIQIAIVDLLRSRHCRPSAIVGHSSGETSAAYAAGAISAEQAIVLNYHRGQITPIIKAAHNGAMAAIGLSSTDVKPFLRPGVIIGCENSPANVTLSGEADILQHIMTDIKISRPEVLVRLLHVECGFHSAHMQTAAPHFSRRISEIFGGDISKPAVPFYSSVSGHLHDDLGASYWMSNLTSPVLFSQALQTLLRDIQHPLLIEIGPHSALSGPIRQTLQHTEVSALYVPTLIRGQDGYMSLLETAGKLWQAGIGMSLEKVDGQNQGKVLADLPRYPWHHDAEYWIESRLSREWRMRKFARHELLGLQVIESGDAAPTWRNTMRVSDVSWMSDHVLFGEVWYPATGFVAMAGEAIRQLTGEVEYTVSNMTIAAALIVTDEPVEIITSLSKIRNNNAERADGRDKRRYNFVISSIAENGCCTEHVYGECCADKWTDDHDTVASEESAITKPHPRKVDPTIFYNTLHKEGLQYGPRFSAMTEATAHTHEKKATATVQGQVRLTSASDTEIAEDSGYSIHPATMDTSIVSSMIASCNGLLRKLENIGVPTFVSDIRVKPHSGPLHVSSSVSEDRTTNVFGFDENGNTVLEVRGLRVQQTNQRSHDRGDADPHGGAVVEWRADPDFLDFQDLPSSLAELVALLSFKNPNIRVLDLKIGPADVFVSNSESPLPDGERLCDKYVVAYTDAQDGSLQRENSATIRALQINLSQDLSDQGLLRGSFDLVIMTTVHGSNEQAVVDTRAFRNIHRLLDYGGRLLLRELMTEEYSQKAHPLTATKLQQAGFEDILSSPFSFQSTYSTTYVSVASTTARAPNQLPAITDKMHQPPTVRVLCKNPSSTAVKKALIALETKGHRNLQTVVLGNPLFNGTNQVGLCLLDLDEPFLFSASESEFESLKQSLSLSDAAVDKTHGVAADAEQRSILWLTGASQISCIEDPNYALTLGFVRSLRRETGDRFVTMEVESLCFDNVSKDTHSSKISTGDAMGVVLSSMSLRATNSLQINQNQRMPLETEYALSDGMLMISRIQEINVQSELEIKESDEAPPKSGPREGKTAAMRPRTLSNVSTLHSRTATRAPTPERETQGKIGYADMTRRADDDTSRGLIMASYAMKEVARVQKGDTVLIHGIETPEGLASLQLARALGLKVSITAKSVMDQHRLTQIAALNIPKDHILVLDIRDGQSTPPPYFDIDSVPFGVVLSLGCKDPATLEALGHFVAPFGFIVVEGVTSRAFHAGLLDVVYQQSLTLSSLNYSQLMTHRPELCSRLLKEAVKSCEQLSRSRVDRHDLDLSVNVDGIDRATKSHRRQCSDSSSDATLGSSVQPKHHITAKSFEVHSNRTYVLIGGLGGLGLSTARFLADRGARCFVFFSRSAEKFALNNKDFVAEMQGYEGCQVHFVSGDIASKDDVMKMASRIAMLPQLGGVFNAAMVLADAMLSEMTYSHWRAAIQPKVDGTWNLHRILFSSCLAAQSKLKEADAQQVVPAVTVAPDAFLFLFSSLSGISQMIGQANYAAANSFLDAFAQYHNYATGGMPAAVLDIGAMEDVGVLARDEKRLERFRNQQGVRLLNEKHFLDAVEVVLGPWQRSSRARIPDIKVTKGSEERKVVGASRSYRSPRQLIIGFGTPSSSSLSPRSRQKTNIRGSSSGLPWDFDPRLAFYAAANQHREGSDPDLSSATTSATPSSPAESDNRQKALKDFLHQARSSGDSPSFLSSPEAINFLSETIVHAIKNLKGEDDDTVGGDGSVAVVRNGAADLTRTLAELGVDSLITVELRTWVRHKLGVNLSVAEFRRAKDIISLVRVIGEKLGGGGGGSS